MPEPHCFINCGYVARFEIGKYKFCDFDFIFGMWEVVLGVGGPWRFCMNLRIGFFISVKKAVETLIGFAWNL